MRFLANKPAFKIALPVILGILFARYVDVNPGVSIFILISATLISAWCYRSGSRWFLLSSACAGLALGHVAYHNASHSPYRQIVEFANLPDAVVVEGNVISYPEQVEDKTSFILQADTIWVRYTPYLTCGKILVRVYNSNLPVWYGDRFVLRGQLRQPPGERNPGDFNYKAYLQAQDIYAVLAVQSPDHVILTATDQGSWLLSEIIFPLKAFTERFIRSTMPVEQAAVIKGLITGMKGDLDPELRDDFSKVGVIHVLAVSGLHVGFLLAGLLGLFKLLRLPDPYRQIAVICLLCLYVLFTGSKPPVIRATIMASIYLIGTMLQRRTNAIQLLSIAALVILIMNPHDLFQPGFQLSFSAVLGIALFYSRLRNKMKHKFSMWREQGQNGRIYLLSLFFVSLSAQLFTLPFTAYYFNRVSILSVFANLFVVPLVGIVVGLGFISVICAAIWWPIGAVFANCNFIFTGILLTIVKTAAEIPGAYFNVVRPSGLLIALYISIIVSLLLWTFAQWRKRFIMLIFVLANTLVWRHVMQDQQYVLITFLDVGQGDATLLQFPNGKTMLVDAGDCTDYVDYGKRVVAPFLRRHAVQSLDVVVGSHAHSDHIGGIPAVLHELDVKRVVLSDTTTESVFIHQIDSLTTAKHIPLITKAAGDTIAGFAPALISVLNPRTPSAAAGERRSNLNNLSLVVQLRFGNTTVLLAADAEEDAEEDMLRFANMLESDILKVGHHGSSTSSSDSFRQIVNARTGIVSVGLYNRFGLPSNEILDQYEKEGTEILRTDNTGAVQYKIYQSHIERSR